MGHWVVCMCQMRMPSVSGHLKRLSQQYHDAQPPHYATGRHLQPLHTTHQNTDSSLKWLSIYKNTQFIYFFCECACACVCVHVCVNLPRCIYLVQYTGPELHLCGLVSIATFVQVFSFSWWTFFAIIISSFSPIQVYILL